MSAAEWVLPPHRLTAEQAAAAVELARFAARHPGIRILTPHYPDEPWRADIRTGTAPGDDRAMILTAHQPADLLVKIEAIFPSG